LDTGGNGASLNAYLRDEPVDHRWVATYERLRLDLLRAVGCACPPRPGHATPTVGRPPHGR
jgi:hypothetical protein